MAVIKATRIMMNMSPLIRCCIIGIVNGIRVLLLQCDVVLLPWQPLRIRILTIWAYVLIVLRCLIWIISFLLQCWPALLPDQRITILLIFLGIIFEECC